MRTDESIFLSLLFESLDGRGVVYAVMRNGDGLPLTLGGSDLDILVKHGELQKARDIAIEVARSRGGSLMGEITSPRFCELAFLGNCDRKWWGSEQDICDGGYVLEPVDDDKVISFRERNRAGVWLLKSECAALLGCSKEILMNRRIPSKYLLAAKQALDTTVEECFLDAGFKELVHESVQAGRAPVMLKWWLCRARLLLLAFLHSPSAYTTQIVGYYVSKASRLFKPVGRFIAVIGTDGSGKSTLLNEVMPALGLTFHKSVRVHHLKPDFLPPLGRLRGIKYENGFVCTNPHGSKPSGFVGSSVRLCYLCLDYMLGYWFKVRIHTARLPVGLWVFDRYAYDMLLDPRRFRIRLPQWMIRLALAFVPQPDLIICLGGDPAKIFSRKPETDIKEVARQVEALKAFAVRHENAIWIDTTTSIEESAENMLGAVKGLSE